MHFYKLTPSYPRKLQKVSIYITCIQSKFLHNHTSHYTDFSRRSTQTAQKPTKTKPASAYRLQNPTRTSSKLYTYTTHIVYSAEMQAIHSALKYIQSLHHNAPQKYIILTDSLSSIHTLKSLASKPQNEIYHSILDIHE